MFPAGVIFFWEDIVCKYWKWAGKVGGLEDLNMKPALSVMQTKAHRWTCQENALHRIHVKISMFTKKQVAFQHWKNGESFERVAKRLGVGEATMEIYVIDLLADGWGMKEDLSRLLSKLEIYEEAFKDVGEKVTKSSVTLREIFDATPLRLSKASLTYQIVSGNLIGNQHYERVTMGVLTLFDVHEAVGHLNFLGNMSVGSEFPNLLRDCAREARIWQKASTCTLPPIPNVKLHPFFELDVAATYVKKIYSGEFFDLSKFLPKTLSLHEEDNLVLSLDNTVIKLSKNTKPSTSITD
ncbi:hypothetical protein ACROYT_G014866 [Oculina patagonica]